MNKNKSLLIVINVDWLFLAHRLEIAKGAQKNGFEVTIVAKDTGRKNEIEAEGFKFIDVNISRSGVNPLHELKTIGELYTIYKKTKPTSVYQVTMKPVIYGTLVSRLLKIPTVNAVSGLGYNFTDKRQGIIQKIMIFLMKLGFHKDKNHLVFENKDDYHDLKAFKVLNHKNTCSVIKGIGVNLEKFELEDFVEKEKLIILFPARMLWDKGVKELIEASKILHEKYAHKIYFKLCGMIDEGNLESISEDYLNSIEVKNYLKWYGHQTDIKSIYINADIVVLPSYREGLPTSLIEACAIGRPIVTTDAVGCRDCVDEGLNGYKVPVKSVQELADALDKLINSPEDRKRMGLYGRQKAENEFNQVEVVKKHVAIFNTI